MAATASSSATLGGIGTTAQAGATTWVAHVPYPLRRTTTLVPGVRWMTPSPTSTTSPAPTAPGVKGSGGRTW